MWSLTLVGCSTYTLQPQVVSCEIKAEIKINSFRLNITGSGYSKEFDDELHSITKSILANSEESDTVLVGSPPPKGMHLIISVNQAGHSGAGAHEFLTALSLGLIPTWTTRDNFYEFSFILNNDGEVVKKSEYTVNRKDYGHIVLLPFAIEEMTRSYYKPAYDHYKNVLNSIVAEKCIV
ncbi:MAG: hypothetical protein JKX76_04280 [Colwellia sp.]|nr:hypothetical protein [Colwellia sp.]